MADIYNITGIQGSTLLLNLNVKNADGTYMILSGYNASGLVRYRYSSSGFLFDLQPKIDTSYVSGLITLSGHATGIAAMPCGAFVYDIMIYNDAGYRLKPIRGDFYVDPYATH